MQKKVKITDLLNPKNFDKYKDDLKEYFENGGTWKDLLGYDQNVLQSQYKKAYDFYSQADYKNAAAAFSYLTMLNPYEYDYWMGLGIAKQSDRLYEEAIVSYIAAESMDPDNPLPHLHLAQCYYALNVRDEAIKQLQATINVSGERAEYKELRQQAATILEHLPK